MEYITDTALAEINDTYTDPSYYYFCEAAPGTLDNEPKWRISRYTLATKRTQWADGNEAFDNVADNRTTLTYI